MYLPYLRKAFGNSDFEAYIQVDNGPGHNDPAVLTYLKEKCRTFVKLSPPNMTPYIQQIDDNVGRCFRNLGYDYLDDWHERSIDEVLREHGSDASPALISAALTLSAAGLRELLVKSIQHATVQWSSDPKYKELAKKAAVRTGLAMRLDTFEGIQPVRFPADYPESIHPNSGAATIEYNDSPAPSPSVVSSTTIALTAVNEGGRLHLDSTITSEGRLSVEALHSTISISLEAVPNRAHQMQARAQEEVEVDDGWSDEEERIYLNQETGEFSSDSESSDDEELPQRRHGSRRRWCLPGCDCERPRGRKCGCELRGKLRCSKNCACDPVRCRSRGNEDDE